VKDLMFSGTDVGEALTSAAATLGLPIAELRYVVLDAGTPGGRGLKPTPARIAVLVRDATGGGGKDRATERAESRARGQVSPGREPDLRTSLGKFVRAVADAGGLEIDSEVEETEEALVLQLHGKDTDFFLGEDGGGEPLLALEHLLLRIHGAAIHPRVLRVRCPAFRERRDQALAEQARRLAAEVRADGEPRTMESLNAYERRVVHLALQEEPGVTTFSVGEGRDRRVRVAPAGAAASEPGASGGDGSTL
jgi:spoIIIJ-associated protein